MIERLNGKNQDKEEQKKTIIELEYMNHEIENKINNIDVSQSVEESRGLGMNFQIIINFINFSILGIKF